MRTEGLELRALVPVSIRVQDERGAAGNRLAAMRGPLPVWVDDPVERLGVVRAAMADLKESKQAIGAEVLANVQNFAPPTVLAQASRINFSTRLFNLLVTNVPGPQFPLYVVGREMQRGLPDRVPAEGPRARDRDHVLQRAHELRPARRLRRDARPRRARGGDRGLARRARGARPEPRQRRASTRIDRSGRGGTASRLPALSTAIV